MHFGYYQFGMNPLRLESMHLRMEQTVLARLALDPRSDQRILDMGCGRGSTLSYAARRYPRSALYGIDREPQYLRYAAVAAAGQVHLVQADFRTAPFPDGSFDGVFALESSCFSPDRDKLPLLLEMFRVLRSGGRMVIADGFIKGRAPLNPVARRAYRQAQSHWSFCRFGTLEAVLDAVVKVGFRDACHDDISWRIVPSALIAPMVAMRFSPPNAAVGTGGSGAKKPPWRCRLSSSTGPLALLVLGAMRTRFGYFLISARK